MARGLMSDAEWAFSEPFIRGVQARDGRQGTDHRRVLDGVFWIARTGSPWRDLPEEFGRWSSVCRQFRRWTLAGLWETILEAPNEGAAEPDHPPDRLQMIDSTVVRAHQHAAGARGGLRDRVSGAQEVARRPRSSSARTDGACRCAACVTPGQTSDHKGFDLVMGDDLPAPAALLTDKGYDPDRIRAWAEARDAIPVIPMRRNRKARAGVDRTLYALRNLVERCFGKLKNSRHVATRYDKTATSFLGFACIRLWTRRSVNTT